MKATGAPAYKYKNLGSKAEKIWDYIFVSVLSLQNYSQNHNWSRFRYCEKVKKFEKISHIFKKILNGVKTKLAIFFKFFWPSQNIWTLEACRFWISFRHNVTKENFGSRFILPTYTLENLEEWTCQHLTWWHHQIWIWGR